MAGRKKTKIDILKKLRDLNKPYFTIADFEKILDQKRNSLYVTLNRLVKAGLLNRMRRGVYQLTFSEDRLEEIANQLYFPSYISFESALSKYGVIDQIPYVLTFATAKKSKKIILDGRVIEYRQIKEELFLGYKLENNVLFAEPEKAVLDQLYFYSLGKTSVNLKEWDLSKIKKEKLLKFSKYYPEKVKKIIKESCLIF